MTSFWCQFNIFANWVMLCAEFVSRDWRAVHSCYWHTESKSTQLLIMCWQSTCVWVNWWIILLCNMRAKYKMILKHWISALKLTEMPNMRPYSSTRMLITPAWKDSCVGSLCVYDLVNLIGWCLNIFFCQNINWNRAWHFIWLERSLIR